MVFGWVDPQTVKALREAEQERAKAAASVAAAPKPYARPRETCRACKGTMRILEDHHVLLCPTCAGAGTVEKPL